MNQRKYLSLIIALTCISQISLAIEKPDTLELSTKIEVYSPLTTTNFTTETNCPQPQATNPTINQTAMLSVTSTIALSTGLALGYKLGYSEADTLAYQSNRHAANNRNIAYLIQNMCKTIQKTSLATQRAGVVGVCSLGFLAHYMRNKTQDTNQIEKIEPTKD